MEWVSNLGACDARVYDREIPESQKVRGGPVTPAKTVTYIDIKLQASPGMRSEESVVSEPWEGKKHGRLYRASYKAYLADKGQLPAESAPVDLGFTPVRRGRKRKDENPAEE